MSGTVDITDSVLQQRLMEHICRADRIDYIVNIDNGMLAVCAYKSGDRCRTLLIPEHSYRSVVPTHTILNGVKRNVKQDEW